MSDLLNATQAGDEDLVAKLMQLGPPADEVRAAMAACITNGPTKLLAVFLRHGANPNAAHPISSWTLMHLASEFANGDALLLLLRHGGDPNAVEKAGCTPLHFTIDSEADGAQQMGHAPTPAATGVLLRAGANPSIKNKLGETFHSGPTADDLDARRTSELGFKCGKSRPPLDCLGA